jgi:SAM-dependent methyltransferase
MTHGHTADLDWATLGEQMERGAKLQLLFVEQAVRWLRTGGADAHRILDVGSGPGVAACVFAGQYPDAEVVAVDSAPALLQHVVARAERHGLADRVRTLHAELPGGFGTLGAADLIWASGALHHLGDQQGALDALASLLRPGGLLAVAEGGLAPRFLPRDIGLGRPGLQSRLDAALDSWFGDMRASLPGTAATVEDWPAMLGRAGLASVGTRSFLVDLPAPLDAAGREQVHGRLAHVRDVAGDRLDDADRSTLDELLDPDAPTGVLHRADVFYLTATTVAVGSKP